LARLFFGSVLAGALLVVFAAGLWPLPRHERYRSEISVVADGGREERFVIQWPQDRVALEAESGMVQAGTAVALAANGVVSASVEVFRLRDIAGNVVGLASRSTSSRMLAGEGNVQGSDWILLIPSRGALFLTQRNGPDVAPRPHPARAGLVPAADDSAGFWSRGSRQRITAAAAGGHGGRILRGTDEFEGLQGSFEETWDLEEIDADGITRGRITLATRLAAAL
jgi:hypothetical protein